MTPGKMLRSRDREQISSSWWKRQGRVQMQRGRPGVFGGTEGPDLHSDHSGDFYTHLPKLTDWSQKQNHSIG